MCPRWVVLESQTSSDPQLERAARELPLPKYARVDLADGTLACGFRDGAAEPSMQVRLGWHWRRGQGADAAPGLGPAVAATLSRPRRETEDGRRDAASRPGGAPPSRFNLLVRLSFCWASAAQHAILDFDLPCPFLIACLGRMVRWSGRGDASAETNEASQGPRPTVEGQPGTRPAQASPRDRSGLRYLCV